VFVDWLRNRRAQSIVCPWSLRVTPTATVAMPLEWDELDATSPDAWDLSTAVDRRAVTPPDPVRLDLDAIAGAAREAGVDLDAEFDRFGRS
jgi:DNA primase